MDKLISLLDMLWIAIAACFDWLEAVFVSYGVPLVVVLVSLVAIHSIFIYVLAPIFKDVGSDKARRGGYNK